MLRGPRKIEPSALLATLLTALLVVWLAPASTATAIVLGEDSPEVVIVNGSLSGAGAPGTAIEQRGATMSMQIPLPEALSAERLLSQHSVPLAATSTCARQFCLVSETIDAQLLAQPEAQYLVGLRFDSQLANTPAKRAPVNLVAVIDRSESMRETTLELTKRSLSELVKHLSDDDQLSLVVYGTNARTYVAPTLLNDKGRKRLLKAIDKLRAGEGASSIEAGLNFGYRLARAASNDFTGTDRVVLFTDEQPDALRFTDVLALAEQGAEHDVSLSLVGVALPFNAELAAALGSVRGANLVFLRKDADPTQLFGPELHTLLSELAHDVHIRITPAAGFQVAGVYGVPGAVVQYSGEQSVEIAVPTAFMGFRAGQLFVSLTRQAEPTPMMLRSDATLARLAVRYVTPASRVAETETLQVSGPIEPSPALQLGRLLIDEFTSLRRASTAYHVEHDQQAAFEHLHAFAPRLRSSRFPGLDGERRLVNTLEEQLAFLTGHADDSELVRSRISRLWGVWRVRSVQGRTDFRANERIEFTPDSKFRFFEKESGRHVVSSVASISTSRQQIVMDYSGVVYNYEVRGSELVLEERPGTLVFLQRSSLD